MFKTLTDFDFSGKKVILRAGFDVPIDEQGKITDNKRIIEGLPTIRYLLSKNASIIILNHIGRPEGKTIDSLSNKVLIQELENFLKIKINFSEQIIGFDVREKVKNIKAGEVLLIENIRFDKREEQNDVYFARELASYGDYYVNDAFSVCHRDHASVTGIPKFIPCCAGLLLEKEIVNLNLEEIKKPFYVIIGGKKLETKIPLIENLAEKADKVLIGGAMIFTFLKAEGFSVGKSIVDDKEIEKAKEIIQKFNDKIVIPSDVVVADKFEEGAKIKNVGISEIPLDWVGVDIGEETIVYFKRILTDAKIIVWNGPLGAYEIKGFEKGSFELAKFVGNLNCRKIAGGGDTADFLQRFGFVEKFSHVSTGGGATLELLSGKKLPGIKALEENYIEYNDVLN